MLASTALMIIWLIQTQFISLTIIFIILVTTVFQSVLFIDQSFHSVRRLPRAKAMMWVKGTV